MIEIWKSPEDAKRFLTERFAPALRPAGFQGPTPRPQFWPVLVHETTQPEQESVTSSANDGGAR